MKKSFSYPILCFAVSASLSAQTTFNVADGDITVGGNWTAGLPTSSGNPGTIGIDGDWNSNNELSNYYVTQTGGTITDSHGGTSRIRGGEWTMNGGVLSLSSVLETGSGGVITINSGASLTSTERADFGDLGVGTVNLSGGSIDVQQTGVLNGSTFNMTAGTLTTNGSNFYTNGGSLVNVSGGTLTTGSFGSMFGGSDGTATFTGGTLNATTLNFRSPDFNLVLGGSTSGSLNFSGGWGRLDGAVDIRWNSGSLMDMTLTGETDWAETVWNAGEMTVDGQDTSTLGNWSAVNGTLFDYDPGTQTLALVPEPSSFALIGLAALAVFMVQRRR
jgi:hypothetical protein